MRYNAGMSNDFYKILGVDRTASEEAIKSAFRKLAKQHHPDKNPGDKAAEAMMKQINQAWDTLGDPAKRKAYDVRSAMPFSGGAHTGRAHDPFADIREAMRRAQEQAARAKQGSSSSSHSGHAGAGSQSNTGGSFWERASNARREQANRASEEFEDLFKNAGKHGSKRPFSKAAEDTAKAADSKGGIYLAVGAAALAGLGWLAYTVERNMRNNRTADEKEGSWAQRTIRESMGTPPVASAMR
jgi:curved DNA-binding protein CbpA